MFKQILLFARFVLLLRGNMHEDVDMKFIKIITIAVGIFALVAFLDSIELIQLPYGNTRGWISFRKSMFYLFPLCILFVLMGVCTIFKLKKLGYVGAVLSCLLCIYVSGDYLVAMINSYRHRYGSFFAQSYNDFCLSESPNETLAPIRAKMLGEWICENGTYMITSDFIRSHCKGGLNYKYYIWNEDRYYLTTDTLNAMNKRGLYKSYRRLGNEIFYPLCLEKDSDNCLTMYLRDEYLMKMDSAYYRYVRNIPQKLYGTWCAIDYDTTACQLTFMPDGKYMFKSERDGKLLNSESGSCIIHFHHRLSKNMDVCNVWLNNGKDDYDFNIYFSGTELTIYSEDNPFGFKTTLDMKRKDNN